MAEERKARPYISVYFKCCKAYARVYLNRAGDAFSGHCPKCTQAVQVKVGEGGSSSRLWTAE